LGFLINNPIFVLKNASAAYRGQPVLHNVNLSIDAGERVVLLGRSGAGKSTLLSLLFQQRNKDSALIPQGYGLVRALSVFHNIFSGRLQCYSAAYNLRNLIWPIRSEIEKISPLAERLGLSEVLFKRAGETSGGQQQRTAVGRALYCGGSVILADEPVSAVDMTHSDAVLEAIETTFPTAILALHDVGLARRFASRILGIKEGRIIFDRKAVDMTAQDVQDLYR
jgi:phosphonate transport system ATP-binding protein